MIVVRESFHLKFGMARQAIELLREGKKIILKFSNSPMRLLSDFTGHSYTLIAESEYESLSEFESNLKKDFSNSEWQNWYEKFKPLVNSSYREIFKVVE
jgi:hypothetical protein